ncbi:G8 domain-containing protein DDB_G0286311-like [Portunus trituberculatus]|uniref:G8 domain-containing protein DDB_G0286311-like n=1 Tax=Portunus trituberculatus TaxID=210409 RepID=UPI001E1D188B|nr:G8 domain-containing protein DDB_G0286311-like [Portunus trituberculatus]
MRALWPLVGCLLYLAASSAVSLSEQCDWKTLNEKNFSQSTIQVRTRHREEGILTVKITDSLQAIDNEILEPSHIYTLNMSCIDSFCTYILLSDDGERINNQTVLSVTTQLTVYGQNLQWSPADCEEMETTTTTTITTNITTKRTTPETTNTTTPETTTTTTTTPRTTTLGKKTPTSTSGQRNKNQGTTTTTTTKPKISRVVIISITVFVFLACGLGLCFIYRHRIHYGALDLYIQARSVREDAQKKHEVMTGTETPV